MGKYDYEIIEPLNQFEMRFEFLFREKDQHQHLDADLKHEIYLMIHALQEGKVPIGSKTRRGLGKGKLKNVRMLDLDLSGTGESTALKHWIDFSWDMLDCDGNVASIDMFKKIGGPVLPERHTKIEASFSLPHSLLIHDYGAALSGATGSDAVHLKSNLGYVLPGTSWAGSIKHQMRRICDLLGLRKDLSDPENGYPIIRDIFGFVHETNKKARASLIEIDESVITNCISFAHIRNRIDRLTGGTAEGGLINEIPVWNAMITLNIHIKDSADYKIGLILLALRDIGSGIQSVGGGASIGRGIFKDMQLCINSNPIDFAQEHDQPYMKALYQYVKDQKSAPKKVSDGGADGKGV
jgi:CRISPR/Cas system CSM-associated protein Csm3 (group 7 of RAMP superfamily)